jgi:hypothetical protein
VSAEATHLLAAVRGLAERLATIPVTVDRGERPNIAGALTQLPAFHALVRSRQGAQVTESLVRTLKTRPLRPPVPIRPLGVPRPLLPIVPAEPHAPAESDGATDDDPPPMFAPR